MHSNILVSEELYYDKNFYVMVSEYFEGGNLHSYVKNLSDLSNLGERK